MVESWPRQLGTGSIRCSGHCDAAKLKFANPDQANEVHILSLGSTASNIINTSSQVISPGKIRKSLDQRVAHFLNSSGQFMSSSGWFKKFRQIYKQFRLVYKQFRPIYKQFEPIYKQFWPICKQFRLVDKKFRPVYKQWRLVYKQFQTINLTGRAQPIPRATMRGGSRKP